MRKELWLDVQDAQRKVADTADKLRQARQQHRDITQQVAAREAPLRRASCPVRSQPCMRLCRSACLTCAWLCAPAARTRPSCAAPLGMQGLSVAAIMHVDSGSVWSTCAHWPSPAEARCHPRTPHALPQEPP